MSSPASVASEGSILAVSSRAGSATDGRGDPRLLFCDNDTNVRRSTPSQQPRVPKDGINDFVISGIQCQPGDGGTKAALDYEITSSPERRQSFGCALARRPHSRRKIPPLDERSSTGNFTRQDEADEYWRRLPQRARAVTKLTSCPGDGRLLWSSSFSLERQTLAEWRPDVATSTAGARAQSQQ